MRKFIVATLGAAGLGAASLLGAGAASATPLDAARTLGQPGATAPVVTDVAWRTVCKNRWVWRQDRWGRPIRVKVRDCDRVWYGKPRHYSDWRHESRPYRSGYDHYRPGYDYRAGPGYPPPYRTY